MSEGCTQQRRVDRHFEGALAPGEERAMREHLPTCAGCRARYERHLLLAELDPMALPPQERLARGLGLAPARARAGRWVAPVSALAMAAALLLFFGLRGRTPDDGEFTARGSGGGVALGSSVLVYRAAPDAKPSRAGDAIGARDELAFAYENASAKRYLMIFGVDEHHHVFWYHPGWADAADDPRSIAIETTPGVHHLHEAIAHQLDGRELEIHALFTDAPLSVKEVERVLAAPSPLPLGASAFPGSAESTLRFRVER